MAKTHPPYAPEFRRQMVDLVRSGRSAGELAREFVCCAQTIRNWVRQARRAPVLAFGRPTGRLVLVFHADVSHSAGEVSRVSMLPEFGVRESPDLAWVLRPVAQASRSPREQVTPPLYNEPLLTNDGFRHGSTHPLTERGIGVRAPAPRARGGPGVPAPPARGSDEAPCKAEVGDRK